MKSVVDVPAGTVPEYHRAECQAELEAGRAFAHVNGGDGYLWYGPKEAPVIGVHGAARDLDELFRQQGERLDLVEELGGGRGLYRRVPLDS